MLRLPALEATTATVPSAYPWLLAPPTPGGVPLGYVTSSAGELWCFDPWSAYEAGWVTGPTMLVLGRSGRGKSALVKTYLARLARRHRLQVIILDPKREYDRVAAALNLTNVELRPGGRDRLNPLEFAGRGPENTMEAVRALVEVGLARPLSPAESLALARLIALLPPGSALPDLVRLGLDPPAGAGAGLFDDTGFAAAAREPCLALAGLIEGELAGMFDGRSTLHLDATSPGVVVDLSGAALGAAMPPVMVAVGAWLLAALSPTADGRRRVVVLDESWAALRLETVTRVLQAVAKLGRSRGAQLIVLAHRPSDLGAQAAAGTEAHAQAQGLAAEAETVVLYGQAPGETQLAAQLFGLSSAEADQLPRLGRGEALWRVGGRSRIVHHQLLAGEIYLVDTDQGMRR